MKLRTKEVNLWPANEWKLDVIVGGSFDDVNEFFKERYGLEYDHTRNCVYTIDSGTESLLKGHTRIVMRLQSLETSVMVHELLHVLWHASKCIGFEMNAGSQEWQACMIEMLYNECKDIKTYEHH